MKKSRLPRPVLWLAGLSICAICVIVILFSVLRLRAPKAFPTLTPEDYDTVLIYDQVGGAITLHGDEAADFVRLLREQTSESRESYHLLYPSLTFALYSGSELRHTFYYDPSGKIANYSYLRQLGRNVHQCDKFFYKNFRESVPNLSHGGKPEVVTAPTAELIRAATLIRDDVETELTPEQIAMLPGLWERLAADGEQENPGDLLFSMEPGACLRLNWGDQLTVEVRQRQLPYNTFVHIRYFGRWNSVQTRYRLPAGYDLFAELE